MSELPKDEQLNSSPESEKGKTGSPAKQDTGIGSTSTTSKASAGASTAGQSASSPRAPLTKSDGEIIRDVLDLFQNDLRALQKYGRVSILARDGVFYASIELPGHKLDTGDGHILLDGLPVSEGD
jgi:hypothetical protein